MRHHHIRLITAGNGYELPFYALCYYAFSAEDTNLWKKLVLVAKDDEAFLAPSLVELRMTTNPPPYLVSVLPLWSALELPVSNLE